MLWGTAVLGALAGGYLLHQGDGFGAWGLLASFGLGFLASRPGCAPDGWRTWEPFHLRRWGPVHLHTPHPDSPEARVRGLVWVVEPCACFRCGRDLSYMAPCMEEDARKRYPHAELRPWPSAEGRAAP